MIPDVSSELQQWFLKISDRTFGPYTTEQILSLLNHREIRAEDQLTNTRLNGRWITVQEFAVLNVNHHLPPRPAEIENQKTGLIQRPESRPLDDLFEILQVAKERQANTSSQPSYIPGPGTDATPSAFPMPLVAGLGVACLLGLAWFGVARLNPASDKVPDISENERPQAAALAAVPPLKKEVKPLVKPTLPATAAFFPRPARNRLGGVSLAHPIAAAPPSISRSRETDRDVDSDRESQDRERYNDQDPQEDRYADLDRDRQGPNQQESRTQRRRVRRAFRSSSPDSSQNPTDYPEDSRAPANYSELGDRSAPQGPGGASQGYPQDNSMGGQGGESDDPSARMAPGDDMTVHSANADEDEAARMGAGSFSPDHNH